MIISFKDKRAEKIWNRDVIKGVAIELQEACFKKLAILNQAKTVNDLRSPPSNHFEKLWGDRKGSCSIRVNKQWRLCFVFEDGDIYEVELVDYH